MENIEMKPQDIVILLKKITQLGHDLSGNKIAESLGVSTFSVSKSLERSRISGLVDQQKKRVNVLALEEFLVHGVRYVFPAVTGRVVRGVPTFVSASPICEQIVAGNEAYVWPSPRGTARGQKVEPLYPTVPEAVQQDEELYRLLVIVDTLRLGRVREREIAIRELHTFVERYVEYNGLVYEQDDD